MDDSERAARQRQLYLEAVGAFGSSLERLAHGYEGLPEARQDPRRLRRELDELDLS